LQESSWPRNGLQIEIKVHETEGRSADAGKVARRFSFPGLDFWIKQMEANDLNFEFVFPECLRQDGSGEKGFEAVDRNLVFHVERECPLSFLQN